MEKHAFRCQTPHYSSSSSSLNSINDSISVPCFFVFVGFSLILVFIFAFIFVLIFVFFICFASSFFFVSICKHCLRKGTWEMQALFGESMDMYKCLSACRCMYIYERVPDKWLNTNIFWTDLNMIFEIFVGFILKLRSTFENCVYDLCVCEYHPNMF